MNVSIANSTKVDVSSLTKWASQPFKSSSDQAVVDDSLIVHGADHHVSSTKTEKHGLTPLKVLGLHATVMTIEHGVHFSLQKSVHYADTPRSQGAGSAKLHVLGDVVGVAASGYLAYRAIEHALHASSSGHTQAAAAYSVSAVLDAGLAIANTLALFKQTPSVSMGVSFGVGLFSTASSVLGAKLEQTNTVSH